MPKQNWAHQAHDISPGLYDDFVEISVQLSDRVQLATVAGQNGAEGPGWLRSVRLLKPRYCAVADRVAFGDVNQRLTTPASL
jgi:hypothetical protein